MNKIGEKVDNMGKRGRNAPGATKARLLAEAEILAEQPDISDIQLVEALKKRGISTTRQTVHMDRKKDLEAMSMDDIKKTKSAMLNEIDNLIRITYNIATAGGDDALRAMDKYDKLFNTKAKVVTMFEQQKMALEQSEKPIINLTIGKAKEHKKEQGKDGNIEQDKELSSSE